MPPRSKIDLARIIAEEFLGSSELVIERFPTGLCHHVFSAESAGADEIVIRISAPEIREYFEGSVFWHDRLKAAGVPLPRLLKVGSVEDVSFVILERLRGEDLGTAYEKLKPGERRAIAFSVASIEDCAAALPMAAGFGHAFSYEDRELKRSWEDVLQGALQRARSWIESVGRASPAHVDSVERKLSGWRSYFSEVKPRAFLDDLTTKNVLVNGGEVTGVVDCDQVCFGDRLYVLGLTRMSLLDMGAETDYIEAWCDAWQLSDVEKKITSVYSAVFCVTFIGELGQPFNGQGRPFDERKYRQYEDLLDTLLEQA